MSASLQATAAKRSRRSSVRGSQQELDGSLDLNGSGAPPQEVRVVFSTCIGPALLKSLTQV